MTFKFIRGQGQGQEMTSVPLGTILLLYVRFCFLTTSREIGWEERLQNDQFNILIFCVAWDVGRKLKLSQSTNFWCEIISIAKFIGNSTYY